MGGERCLKRASFRSRAAREVPRASTQPFRSPGTTSSAEPSATPVATGMTTPDHNGGENPHASGEGEAPATGAGTVEATTRKRERVNDEEFTCGICSDILWHATTTACCGNSFCRSRCLLPWLAKSNTCPTCRKYIGAAPAQSVIIQNAITSMYPDEVPRLQDREREAVAAAQNPLPQEREDQEDPPGPELVAHAVDDEENAGSLSYLLADMLGTYQLAYKIEEALETAPATRRLVLKDIGVTNEGIVALGKALAEAPQALQTLDIAGNEIQDTAFVSLMEGLLLAQMVTGLLVLGLEYNKLGGRSAFALADALRAEPRARLDLEELRLGCNSIGSEGLVVLAGAIQTQTLPGLRKLDVAGNDIGDEGIVALAGAIHGLRALQELDLSGNKIGIRGAVALAGALQAEPQMPRLRRLNMNYNSIGNEGVAALAGAIETQPQVLQALQKLYLEHNNIGDEGVGALAGTIHALQALQELGLGGNKIGNRGAVALADALQAALLPRLRDLSLEWNEIGDEGIGALARALQAQPLMLRELRDLRLDTNNIGSEGIAALARALQAAPQMLPALKILSLRENCIDAEGVAAIADAVRAAPQALPALRGVHLENNRVGVEGVAALAEALFPRAYVD